MTSNAEQKRENRLRLQEDHIGRALAESEANGELRSAASYGKPLNLGDGYDETPAELRMAMKALKDAGVVPAEVELMQRLAAVRAAADVAEAAADAEEARRLRQQASEMQQALSLRLEHLRSGSL